MIRLMFVAGVLAILAGCGVDGAPERPEPKSAPASGVSVIGSGYVGAAKQL
ncbi:argininosuccinate lyase [Pseudoruegeria sp. SK021]|uniref:argininosuccinate lyase n=1 Tax=Pseudoruegeria sp. SK021 TaxID=1933035 RepID=UPI00111C8625|nr:argininosuccinate lyase [Pseudoruegeria sp. SK021]